MTLTETFMGMLFIILVVIIYTINIKNIVNPLMIFILPTGIAYVLYYYYFQSFWTISQETNAIFFIGECMFLVGYTIQSLLASSMKKIYFGIKIQDGFKKIHFEKNYFVWFFYSIGMLMNVMTIIKLTTLGAGTPNFRDEFINIVGTLPSYVIYGKYISMFAIISLLYSYIITGLKRIFLIPIIFGILLTYYTANLTQARTDILIVFMPIVILFIMLKMNKNSWLAFLKYGLIGVFGLVALYFSFLVIQVARFGTTDVSFFSSENQTFQYISLPLTAFDKWMVIPDLASARHGFGLVDPLDKFLKLFHVDQYELMFAPIGQFNVYSYLAAPFLAFGKVGVAVVLCIAGMFNKWIFDMSKISSYYLLFYVFFEVSVLLSFYSWQMMSTVNLYALVYVVLLWFSERRLHENKFNY